jgi:acetyl-CoA carboxylase biotin carboxyl carrier protein
MNTARILELIDLVAETGMAELAVADGGSELHIVRRLEAVAPVQGPAARMPTQQLPTAADVPPLAEPAPSHTVAAPMAGTFYRGASPGSEPFAKVGTVVEAGAPLCVIEAMKVMNEVTAEHAGTVVQILGEDGQAIGRGQPLFVIE